jgi:hypothetical protein
VHPKVRGSRLHPFCLLYWGIRAEDESNSDSGLRCHLNCRHILGLTRIVVVVGKREARRRTEEMSLGKENFIQ